MRVAALECSLQQADNTQRGIAGLVVASLKGGQFLESTLTSLLQLHSLCRREGTSFESKLDPQFKSTLQLRQGRREAGMNRTPAPLASDFTRPRLKTLL